MLKDIDTARAVPVRQLLWHNYGVCSRTYRRLQHWNRPICNTSCRTSCLSSNTIWDLRVNFFFNLCGGALGTAATSGLLFQPRMIGEGDCGEIGGMKIGLRVKDVNTARAVSERQLLWREYDVCSLTHRRLQHWNRSICNTSWRSSCLSSSKILDLQVHLFMRALDVA
jgi:hypothetical protein